MELLDGLKNSNEEIESLDISHNNIDCEGVEYLVSYIKEKESEDDGFEGIRSIISESEKENCIVISLNII